MFITVRATLITLIRTIAVGCTIAPQIGCFCFLGIEEVLTSGQRRIYFPIGVHSITTGRIPGNTKQTEKSLIDYYHDHSRKDILPLEECIICIIVISLFIPNTILYLYTTYRGYSCLTYTISVLFVKLLFSA